MRYRKIVPVLIGLAAMAAVACSGGGPASPPATQAASTATPSPEERRPAADQTHPPALQTPVAEGTGSAQAELPPPQLDVPAPQYLTFGWKTDFSKHSVPYDEITPGGPRRDGIPPIDNPKFANVAEAPDYLRDEEQVISLEIGGDATAYPIAILIWHEIVNDEVGGVPVTITYCPLCNTAIVFDRTVDGRVLDFGTSGNVRKSDLVMWDRQTESWWQQINGEAIVGELTGTLLDFIPAALIGWNEFKTAFPDGKVLTRDTGYAKTYGFPPYGGYDEAGSRPFLFTGEIDPRFDATERVVGLSIEGESVAYPFSLLEEHPVINDKVGGRDLVVFFAGETASPFAAIGAGQPNIVGSTGVFEPFVDGDKLTFAIEDGAIVDVQTGSKWNILGKAVDGSLEGEVLAPVIHANHFWFAWAAFNPDSAVRTAEEVTDGAASAS